MITKKIKKDQRMACLLHAIAYSALAAVIIFSFILLTDNQGKMLEAVIVELCILVVLCLLSQIVASKRLHVIKKYIKKQQASVSLDDDAYEVIGKNLALGKQWLVYHHGNYFRPISHESIHSVSLQNKKMLIYVDGGCISIPMHKKDESAYHAIQAWLEV